MIRIDVNTADVHVALKELQARMRDLSPALRDIGEQLALTTKQRFATKTAPDGSPWAANSPLTQALKGRNDPLIGETGSLSGQIHYNVGATRIELGSTMEYAAVQQFGAKQGAFGRTKKNNPIPWGDIPARPFLGLSTDDEAKVLDIIAEHFGLQ